jgi:uncharacterized protein YkwD
MAEKPPREPRSPAQLLRRFAYPMLAAGVLVMTFGFATTGSAKDGSPPPKNLGIAQTGAKSTPTPSVAAVTPTVTATVGITPPADATLTPEQAVLTQPGTNDPNATPLPAQTTATPTSTVIVTTTPKLPTPRATSTTGPSITPGTTSMASLETDLLTAHNSARTAVNVTALDLDPKLVTIARARAQDMATRNYFSHTSPGGDTAFSLLGQASYAYTIAAENIARNNYPDAQAVSVAMDGFLNSPSHKENIIDPRFKTVGIGVALGADGMKYIAVVFAG